MNRIPMCVVTGVVLCGAAAAERPQAPPPRPAVDVTGLVRQLGSDHFAEREEATKRLSSLDVPEVPAALLAALKSDSPEVRGRAARAVKALREYIAQAPERATIARLPRDERFARRGQIDLYVASTAASKYNADDDRLWEPVLDLYRNLFERTDSFRGVTKPRSWPEFYKDFRSYRVWNRGMRFVRTDELYAPPKGYVRNYPRAILAAGVKESETLHGFVVSRGPVAAPMSQCLLLTTGDLSSKYEIWNSIIVCDGDVRVGKYVESSLIIARGDITVAEHAGASTLVAGGTVTLGKPPEPLPPPPRPKRNPPDGDDDAARMQWEDKWKNRVVIDEHQPRPLGYVTFFELSAVGVEVKAAGGAIRVSGVAAGKLCAAAGVKVGDLITAVNGKKPDSAESLRRLLRDALAIGDAAVTLTRGEKTLTVKVALPE